MKASGLFDPVKFLLQPHKRRLLLEQIRLEELRKGFRILDRFKHFGRSIVVWKLSGSVIQTAGSNTDTFSKPPILEALRATPPCPTQLVWLREKHSR